MRRKLWQRVLALMLTLVMVLGLSAVGDLAVFAETASDSTKIEDSVTTSTHEMFKFQYTGSWGVSTDYPTMFSNGDEHYSNNVGTYYEIAFVGTKIEIYATKANNHGTYNVYIDGQSAGEANAIISSSTREHQQLIYASEELEDGEHTIKVELPQNADKAIQVDYAIVYHNEIIPTGLTLGEGKMNLECGMSKTVTVSAVPSYATVGALEWSSSDETVATVADGVVTAVAQERKSAVITATIKGTEISASMTVNVFPAVEYLGAFVGSCDVLDIQEDYEQYLTEYEDSWSDIAWKGDILTSKIVTTSREETVKNAEIIASDFVNENGKVITADHVDIKWLKNIEANIGRGNAGAPVKEFPDIIYKGGKIDIAPETLQSAWISIHVPEDAVSGTYQGTMTICADGLEDPYVFNYEFTVLNLVQPTTEEVGTQIQLWQHPFSVANYYLGLGSQPSGGISNEVREDFYFTEAHFNLMRESMKEYAAIGGHDVVANIVEEAWGHQSYYNDLSMVKWTKKSDGTFTFDYDWYDKWINFMIETGVLDPENGIGMIKCYSIVPWNNQITYYDEAAGSTMAKSYTPGNSDWAEIWTIFLNDFMAHSKEKGWFDITYISMDERSMAQLQPAVELISSIQDEEGKSFKISSAFNYNAQSGYEFSDKIYDISINLGNVPNSSEAMRDLAEHRKELGLLTTIYTCTGNYPGNFTISDPAENTWTMWYSLAHGTDGFMRWAYDNYVYDMLGNVTYRYWEPGDGWFIYPVSREEAGDMSADVGFYSTPRYEMLKKGLRDINKAKYLMSLSEELKAEVTELVESIQQPRQSGSYGSAVASTEADRQLTISEANRMRNKILEISAGIAEPEIPAEPPIHEHTWGEWKVKSEATVFAAKEEVRKCSECGEEAARTVGTKLKATITTNAKSNQITLKKNQKSTGFRITGLAKGDSIVSIKSSNAEVVKVSKVNLKKGTCTLTAGKLTGNKGKAEITITLKSGLKKVIKVTVQAASVKTTAITGLEKKLTLKKGKSLTLKPVLVPFTSQEKVKFTSGKKSVATVSSKGQIKAKKKGTATITVKAGKKTVKVKVTVK